MTAFYTTKRLAALAADWPASLGGFTAALVAAYEAGEFTAQQWAELCTRIPGLEAAYQRKGTYTDN